MATGPTPHRPPRLDVAAVRDWLGQADAPRLIDVRSPGEFAAAHIAGSYHVPLHLLREHPRELRRYLDQVVLVCRSGAQAEQALAEVQLSHVHILDGGITAWRAADAPIRRGRSRWDLERQVRLAAGGLVLTGVLGDLAVPGLRWLAAAVGAGLVVAAVTNTCLMGSLLARVPGNREPACDLDTVVAQLGGAAAPVATRRRGRTPAGRRPKPEADPLSGPHGYGTNGTPQDRSGGPG